MEELYIRAIKGAILKLKNPKTSEEDRTEAMRAAGRNLGKLRLINEGFYLDLLEEYKTVIPYDG